MLKLKSSRKKYKPRLKISILCLTVTYIFTGYLIYSNSKPTQLFIEDNYVEFKGNYGFKLNFYDIKNIQQITLIPEIRSKISGFSLMNIRKGKFKTTTGKAVYLLINGSSKPILKITKKNKEVIYFNSSKENIKQEYLKLQNIFSYQK